MFVKNGKNQTKGFTLVELLVVISIIALLVSILMPALNKARMQAQRVVCSSNIRQLYLGVLMYADNNSDKMPYHISGDSTSLEYNPYKTYSIRHTTTPANDLVQGLGRLYNNGIGDLEIYFCPSMKDTSYSYPTMPKNAPFNDDSIFQLDFNQWVGDEPYRMPGRSAYSYRAGDFEPFKPKWWERKMTLDLFKKGQKAFIADLWTAAVDEPSSIAHKEGFNVGFTDGHVGWNPVDDYSQISTDFLQVINYWSYMDINMD